MVFLALYNTGEKSCFIYDEQTARKGDNVRKYYLSYDWEHKIATVMKPVAEVNGNDENYF